MHGGGREGPAADMHGSSREGPAVDMYGEGIREGGSLAKVWLAPVTGVQYASTCSSCVGGWVGCCRGASTELVTSHARTPLPPALPTKRRRARLGLVCLYASPRGHRVFQLEGDATLALHLHHPVHSCVTAGPGGHHALVSKDCAALCSAHLEPRDGTSGQHVPVRLPHADRRAAGKGACWGGWERGVWGCVGASEVGFALQGLKPL
eukprot:366060-Chlamydomonas_euryale.AAC.9